MINIFFQVYNPIVAVIAVMLSTKKEKISILFFILSTISIFYHDKKTAKKINH